MNRRDALRTDLDRLMSGSVSPYIYAVLRIALGLTLLVRHSDWLRPFVFLEHHRWVHGLEYLEGAKAGPALVSPMAAWLTLGKTATRGLVYARTGLAVLLVVGVWPRLAAFTLAVVCYALLASDRYRYLHHLHLLYLSIAWLSFAPLGDRLSLSRLWAKRSPNQRSPEPPPKTSPKWPLQLIRALALGVYVAAGLAKLNASWLGGETLRELDNLHVVGGSTWVLGKTLLGDAGMAWLVVSAELGLPLLLVVPRTRRAAVIVGWIFHGFISGVMGVSTFGVEMAILLLAFWQTDRETVEV